MKCPIAPYLRCGTKGWVSAEPSHNTGPAWCRGRSPDGSLLPCETQGRSTQTNPEGGVILTNAAESTNEPIQPGDILYYGSSGPVMYIGNGMIIPVGSSHGVRLWRSCLEAMTPWLLFYSRKEPDSL